MITALAPLGAKYRLQFVPEYGTDGTVSVAVIYSLKSVAEDEAVPKTLSFSGTVAEVEAALVEQLPQAVEKLLAHATTLEDLDRQLEAEKKEKEDEKKSGSGKGGKSTAKPADKKPTPEEKKKDDAPPAEPPPTPPAAAAPAGLTPAWKGKGGKKRGAAEASAPAEPVAPAPAVSMANVPATTPAPTTEPASAPLPDASSPGTVVTDVGATPAAPADDEPPADLGSLFGDDPEPAAEAVPSETKS